MSFLSSLLVATTAAVCARALPANIVADSGAASLLPPVIPPPIVDGYSDGFYYWGASTGAANITFVNGPAGEYGLTWGYEHYAVEAGKGWNPGSSDRIINYRGSYQPGGISYLTVHGWTTNPLIEYFIVESNNGAEGHPYSAAQRKGTVTCDGAKYDVLQGARYDIRVDGVILPIKLFWSVRYPKKYPGEAINGTVNTACHFNGWKGFGMELGSDFDYQILSIEGYYSRGSANITVSEG